MARKLNQIVAIEKGVKSRVYGEFTRLHKSSQRADRVAGFNKTWERKGDADEEFPPERKKVQLIVSDLLVEVGELLTELFDTTATKDYANTHARADVKVGDRVLVKDAPVPYLLFLEKQLSDLDTFIGKLPTLDDSEEWALDPNTNVFKTEPTRVHRTRKVQRPIVLYDATEHHPAQTQLVSEDVIVGHWRTVKMSGALPVPRKRELQARLRRLQKAVKFAREEANNAEVVEQRAGEAVFDFLLNG